MTSDNKLTITKEPEQNTADISVTYEQLREIRLMVCTPCYGGIASGFYMNSVIELSRVLNQCGIGHAFNFIFNESLITRARNYCAASFLNADVNFTHLFFIDSDIEFSSDAAMNLLALSILNPDKGIFVGAYPKKNIAYEKIKAAVDQGRADDNPFTLENYTGDFVIGRMNTDQEAVPLNKIVEVSEAGTGFMLIKREVFEAFGKAHPELYYIPDHARSEEFNGSKEICQFFNAEIDPKSRRYLSEDYYFCYKAKELGYGTWLAPWINLNHIGNHRFVGNLPLVASLGASLTVNAEDAALQIKESKNKRGIK